MQSINLTDIFYVISLYYIFTIWGHLHWQQVSFWMSHFSGAKWPHLVNISCLCECVWVCECVSVCLCVLIHSVVSDSLRSHGLYPARPLCPQDSPGKNPGVGCHFLFQGIFLTRGSSLHFLCLQQWQVDPFLPNYQGTTNISHTKKHIPKATQFPLRIIDVSRLKSLEKWLMTISRKHNWEIMNYPTFL